MPLSLDLKNMNSSVDRNVIGLYEEFLFFLKIEITSRNMPSKKLITTYHSRYRIMYLFHSSLNHIGTECPLSGPKFSSAETGMGVTYRP